MQMKENDFVIRNFCEQYAESVGNINKLLELLYCYNPDYKKENIFCALDGASQVIGVGHLEEHDTWRIIDKEQVPEHFIFKLELTVSLHPNFALVKGLKDALISRLLERAKEIRAAYPNKKIRVFTWLSTDENDEIDFYLSQGFCSHKNALAMKRDLMEEITEVPAPEALILSFLC